MNTRTVCHRSRTPEELNDRLDELAEEERAVFKEWRNFDLRIVPPEKLVTSPYLAAQQRVWFRYRHPLPGDTVFHVGTLAT